MTHSPSGARRGGLLRVLMGTVLFIALLIFSARRDIMGEHAAGPLVRVLAAVGAVTVLGLNFVLLSVFFGVPVPFLGE